MQNQKSTVICRPSLIKSVAGNIKHRAAFCLHKIIKEEWCMLVEIMKVKNEEVTVVTSLDVAETFGKEHARVLRDIRDLDCSDEFRVGNFAESYYINSQKKKQPLYYITRDGFTLLVMGYTGEKAMKFKEAYIKQFNAMEKALIGKIKEREKELQLDRL